MNRILLFLCLLIFHFGFGQTNTWNGSNNNDWDTAANWSLNLVPIAAHDVVVPATFVPVINTNAVCKSLNISGTLTIGNNNANRTLTVSGDVTINGGGIFQTAGNGGNSLLISGNFVNNGTFNMNVVGGANAGVTFNGTASQTISGVGTTTNFNSITLTNASPLVINCTITVGSDWINNAKTVSGTGVVTFTGTSTIAGPTVTAFPNLLIKGMVRQEINTIVSGNFTIESDTYIVNDASSYTLTIGGNYSQTGGVFNFNDGASGTSTVYLAGNLTNTSVAVGSMHTAGNARNGTIIFNGIGTQVLNMSKPQAALWVNYIVNSGTTLQLASNLTLTRENPAAPATYVGEITVNGAIDLGTYRVSEAGGTSGGGYVARFTLNSGATLITANVGGIDGSVSSTNMTRTFSIGANYNFNGSLAQITSVGMSTTVNNLSLNNPLGVTLSNATAVTTSFSIASSAIANLGTFTHTAGNLSLGGFTTPSGSWGSTTSSATYKNNTYFATTTGIVNVGTSSCISPIVYTITGSGNLCTGSAGNSIELSNSEVGASYQLVRNSVNVGSVVAGTGSPLSFGLQNSTGDYTVIATRDSTFCTVTMTGVVTIYIASLPPMPVGSTIVDTNCSGSTGSITLTNQNHALQFVKANSQYVRTITPFLSGLKAFTMEGWIKYKTSDLNAVFTSLFGQNNVVEFGFENGLLHLYTKLGGYIYATPPVNFGDNTWHHIAAVGTGSQILIYADGVLVRSGGSGIGAGTYGSHTDNVNIGAGVFNRTGDFFGGQIMKVGFYNTALSASRIASLAYSPITYTGTETGLIAGYNFMEGSGTTLTSVPAGKNGTLVNTPTWIDPYTYAWTKTGTPAYTATTRNITGLSSGEYNLSFDIGKGCPRAVSYNIGTKSTEWNGSAWSPTLPTINDKLTFTGDYTSSGSINGCSCEITSGNVLIKSGDILTITNSVIVNNNPTTSLTFENNASLVQFNNAAVNTGTIVYKRNTSPMKNFDYTYWSSPVQGQTAKLLSPNTWVDKYFRYNGGWVFDDGIMDFGVGFIIRTPKPGTYGAPYPEVVSMPYTQEVTFKGVPNNGTKSLTIGTTDGNNNLIGNPYPSAMSADAFLTANNKEIDGTIYFWTHNTVITNLKYTATDYAAYNGVGGVGTSGNFAVEWNDSNFNGSIDFGEWSDNNSNGVYEPGEWVDANLDTIFDRGEWEDVNGNNILELGEWTDANHNGIIDSGEWLDANNNGVLDQTLTEKTSNKPLGNIVAGQSFFAITKKGLGATGAVTFDNNMRVGVANSNSQFFKGTNSKTTAIVKDRVWLNLTNKQGAFKQTLVGYVTGATHGNDTAFDGESFDANKYIDFYSINDSKNLVIQGRALPFDKTDKVPLGYKTTVEGTFAISIDQIDGALVNQTVFVEDKVANVIHNLKKGAYSFSTLKGVFNDRFVLRYMDNSVVVIPPVVTPPVVLDPNQGGDITLGTDGFNPKGRAVIVSVKNRQIKINSFDETIGTVKVFDLRGRLLYQKEHVNKNEWVISSLDSSNQYLIVLTQLINGKWITKEIIF